MRKLVSNGIQHSINKLALLAFPLLVIPLLISRVGMEAYGKYAFYMSIVLFFQIFISYGFEESATKRVAKGFESLNLEGRFVCLVVLFKSILFLIVLVFSYLILVLWLDKLVLWLFFLILLQEPINLFWYYQGKQKLKVINITLIVGRFLFLLSIYFFVMDFSDFIYIPVLQFFIYSLVNIFPLYVALKKLPLVMPFFKDVKAIAMDSFSLAVTNLVPVLKDRGGVLALGGDAQMLNAGALDVMMKILNLVFLPVNILNSSFFPELARNYRSGLFQLLVKIVFIYSVIIVLLVTIVFWLFNDLVPEDYRYFLSEFSILIVSVFFYSISVVIAKNNLIIFGRYGEVFLSLCVSTLFYLGAIWLFYLFHGLTLMIMVLVTLTAFAFEMLLRVVIVNKAGEGNGY